MFLLLFVIVIGVGALATFGLLWVAVSMDRASEGERPGGLRDEAPPRGATAGGQNPAPPAGPGE
jgi:hypothetical protein